MNKWKVSFWSCLAALIISLAFGFYFVLDQGVTITYLNDGYSKTESDLKALIEIINNSDLSKSQVTNQLSKIKEFEQFQMERDTIYLNRISLIFKNDKLIKINEQWWIRE